MVTSSETRPNWHSLKCIYKAYTFRTLLAHGCARTLSNNEKIKVSDHRKSCDLIHVYPNMVNTM